MAASDCLTEPALDFAAIDEICAIVESADDGSPGLTVRGALKLAAARGNARAAYWAAQFDAADQAKAGGAA